MRRSLTLQIAMRFISLLAGILVVCWLINTVFLEKFYLVNKQSSLQEGYNRLNSVSLNENTVGSEELGLAMEEISTSGNIMIIIINPSAKVIASTVNDTAALQEQLLELLFNNSFQDDSIIERNRKYCLQRITGGKLDTEYLVLWGNLDNGNLILMRTPLTSIRESVDISNKFLSYISVSVMALSLFMIYYVTRRITSPILQLADISEKMANLDFNTKYYAENKVGNEVDLLGEHINMLSEKLERTISDLKSANNELKLDNERKEKNDEMRKEFLSNISHELKTPLALIRGYAEGLAECVNDDEESRQFYCDVIMDEADKMNKMVVKLLELNQLEFAPDAVTMERFDLVELLQGVLNVAGLLMKQNGITLIFEAKEPVYVWADEYKVEEVFTNYLNNAIHYAEDRKEIHVRLEKRENVVRVSVFNTGKPIPESDIDRIWDKFYKVDKARTREYGGSGVGLSIVKAIMESFHQQYGVKNYADGVEFWFELDGSSQEQGAVLPEKKENRS